MFNEIRQKLNDVKMQIKTIDKKTAINEYLSLLRQKAELEKKINDVRIKAIEREKNKKQRNKNNHVKFLVGGVVVKHYPNILKFSNDKDIETAIDKILKIENQNNDYYEINKEKFEIITRDGEEYYKVKKQN